MAQRQWRLVVLAACAITSSCVEAGSTAEYSRHASALRTYLFGGNSSYDKQSPATSSRAETYDTAPGVFSAGTTVAGGTRSQQPD